MLFQNFGHFGVSIRAALTFRPHSFVFAATKTWEVILIQMIQECQGTLFWLVWRAGKPARNRPGTKQSQSAVIRLHKNLARRLEWTGWTTDHLRQKQSAGQNGQRGQTVRYVCPRSDSCALAISGKCTKLGSTLSTEILESHDWVQSLASSTKLVELTNVLQILCSVAERGKLWMPLHLKRELLRQIKVAFKKA